MTLAICTLLFAYFAWSFASIIRAEHIRRSLLKLSDEPLRDDAHGDCFPVTPDDFKPFHVD